MIHVLAIITAKPGRRDELLGHVRDNLAAVHAEEGCLAYEPVVDVPDFGGMQAELGPDAFVMVERWSSAAALKAHAAAPHMKAYGERTRDLVAGRVIHVLEPA